MEFAQCYPELVARAWNDGKRRTARGRPHRALFNLLITTHARPNLHPTCSKKFAIAELMAYVAGWNDVAWLERFNKNIAQFSDDGKTFAGAYGPRMAWSWGRLFELLREDPDTRQAICQIYTPHDLTAISKDKPCNTMFQLQREGPFLNMSLYQRSCDLIWGLPYDHFSFATILILIANELDLLPGHVTRFIANAHVYEPHAEYYGIDRIHKAMALVNMEMWYPPKLKFFDFRDLAIETRRMIDSAGCARGTDGAVGLAQLLLGDTK